MTKAIRNTIYYLSTYENLSVYIHKISNLA